MDWGGYMFSEISQTEKHTPCHHLYVESEK